MDKLAGRSFGAQARTSLLLQPHTAALNQPAILLLHTSGQLRPWDVPLLPCGCHFGQAAGDEAAPVLLETALSWDLGVCEPQPSSP